MKIFRILLINIIIVAFNVSVSAQGICATFESVVKSWPTKYQEIPVASATASGQSGASLKFILFVSPKATFSLFVVRPDGLACLIAAGENWESFKPETQGEKS